jgi:hypothetical protein
MQLVSDLAAEALHDQKFPDKFALYRWQVGIVICSRKASTAVQLLNLHKA